MHLFWNKPCLHASHISLFPLTTLTQLKSSPWPPHSEHGQLCHSERQGCILRQFAPSPNGSHPVILLSSCFRFVPVSACAQTWTITLSCFFQYPRGLSVYAHTRTHELSLQPALSPLTFLTLANGAGVHLVIEVKTQTKMKAGVGGNFRVIWFVRIACERRAKRLW